MKSLLIQDTTQEERQKIVQGGLADMYDDYIYGFRELDEINMSFRTTFVRDMKGPERTGCGY